MPVGVVDLFEVVEVGHDDTERSPLTLSALELSSQDVKDCGVIPQPRQRIVGGLHAQRVARRNELLLQIENPLSRVQMSPELVGVERLDEIVVRARLDAFDQVLLPIPRRQHQDINVRMVCSFPESSADLDAFHSGHHPVEDSELGGAVLLEDLPRFLAVSGNDDLIPPPREKCFEHVARNWIVFGNQDPHLATSLPSPASAFVRCSRACSRIAQASWACPKSLRSAAFSSASAASRAAGAAKLPT